MPILANKPAKITIFFIIVVVFLTELFLLFSRCKSISNGFHKYFKKIRLLLNALLQGNYYNFVKSKVEYSIFCQISVILHCESCSLGI